MDKLIQQILCEIEELKKGLTRIENKIDITEKKLDGMIGVGSKIDGLDGKIDNLKDSIIEGLVPYFDKIHNKLN
ncbi:hypothetical protein [Bacillus sp. FSL M8-0168]|uniref:hypothetical protein n=1 Tax=Bacillus sp. FSL M8-0168 TaxID=2921614 RepID=UPI0030FD524F